MTNSAHSCACPAPREAGSVPVLPQRLTAAANNAVDLAFGWDPSEPVATRPLVWNRSGTLAFYVHDGNKNISEVIETDGAMSAHYEFAPFGTLTLAIGDCVFRNPWRFSSEYAEDNISLSHYNFRHYDPVHGRWVSQDLLDELFDFYEDDRVYFQLQEMACGFVAMEAINKELEQKLGEE